MFITLIDIDIIEAPLFGAKHFSVHLVEAKTHHVSVCERVYVRL